MLVVLHISSLCASSLIFYRARHTQRFVCVSQLKISSSVIHLCYESFFAILNWRGKVITGKHKYLKITPKVSFLVYTIKRLRKFSTVCEKSMTLVSLQAIIPPHMNAIYFPLKPGFLSAIFCAVPLLLPGFHIHYSPLPLQHTAWPACTM